MSKIEERELARHLARLDHESAQQVLDELAGRMDRTVVRDPIRYCLSLVDRLERGLFTPELGLEVARRREADRRQQAAGRRPQAISSKAGEAGNALPDALRATLERIRSLSAGATQITPRNGDESCDSAGPPEPQ